MSPSTCCEFLISSRAEIKYHARLDELERVDETAVDLGDLSLVARVISLGLTITRTSINTGTFGERVVITGRHTVELKVLISLSVEFFRVIYVIETRRQRTTNERSSRTQVQTIALQAQCIFAESCSLTPLIGIESRLMLEVLRFGEKLNNFKVVIATQEDQLAVLSKFTANTSGIASTVFGQLIADSK